MSSFTLRDLPPWWNEVREKAKAEGGLPRAIFRLLDEYRTGERRVYGVFDRDGDERDLLMSVWDTHEQAVAEIERLKAASCDYHIIKALTIRTDADQSIAAEDSVDLEPFEAPALIAGNVLDEMTRVINCHAGYLPVPESLQRVRFDVSNVALPCRDEVGAEHHSFQFNRGTAGTFRCHCGQWKALSDETGAVTYVTAADTP